MIKIIDKKIWSKPFIHVSSYQLFICGLIWAGIPVLLTVLFWFKFIISIPVLSLSVFSIIRFLRKERLNNPQSSSSKFLSSKSGNKSLSINLLLIACLIYLGVWLISTGFAGYLPSETGDNNYRNGVFDNLITHSWPVQDSTYRDFAYLSYYFSYWTPAALIGKIFASFKIAYAALFIYSYCGLALTFLMICQMTGKRFFLIALILSLFTSCDIFLSVIFDLPKLNPLSETGSDFMGAPCAAYIVTYIYNQGIPAWVLLLMMYRYRHNSGFLLLLYSLLLLPAPFVALGITPLTAIFLTKNIKRSFSLCNFCGLMLCLLTCTLFIGNTHASEGLKFLWDILPAPYIIVHLIGWLGLNIIIFLPFVWHRIGNKKLFFVLLISVTLFGMICPAYENYDFGWKVPISLMFYLIVLLCIEASERDWKTFSWNNMILAAILIVGMSGNYIYIKAMHLRMIKCYELHTITRRPEYLRYQLFNPKVNKNCYNSFVTDHPTFWSKYLMPDKPVIPSCDPES